MERGVYGEHGVHVQRHVMMEYGNGIDHDYIINELLFDATYKVIFISHRFNRLLTKGIGI
jgi:hypothetical protein